MGAPGSLFTTLPNETLQQIFEEARLLDERPMKGGTSKALLPFTRRNYFHTVKLESKAHFEKLMAALVHRPSFFATHPLSLIESFLVNIGEHETEDRRWTQEYLTPLFRGLKSVRNMTLSNSSDLIFTFLSLDVASSLDLAHLESLKLDMVCGSWTEVWNYRCFAAIHHHANLKKLHVHYLDSDDSPRYQLNDPPATPQWYKEVEPPLCTSVSEVIWSGMWGICSFGYLGDFLANFPGLTRLTIEDSANLASFSEEFTDVLPGLEHLVLRRTDEFEALDGYFESFKKLVPKIPNIVTLTISNNILLCEEDVPEEDYLEDFHSLRDFQRLEKLTLDDSCLDTFTPEIFKILLKPRTRPPHLREIEVNIFPGSMGVGMNQLMPGIDHGWKMVGWRRNFDYRDACQLIDDAELAGIEITGTIHEGIDCHLGICGAMRVLRMMEGEDV